jgi:N-acetylglutamate synthase-like GNAT family acetyltransferase
MSIPMIQGSPERAAAIRLLQASELPTSDLTDAHMGDFFYAGDSGAPVGLVGLEFYGGNALLRSLAVASERRGSGLGSALVERAESHARARGARLIFLLTTTAERFFKSRGYVPADRATAPEAIRTSREFADLCPASSAFLVKQL